MVPSKLLYVDAKTKLRELWMMLTVMSAGLLDMVPDKLPDVDAKAKSRELWRMLKVMSAKLLDMVPIKLRDVDAKTKSRELWRMLKVMPAGTLTFLGPKLEDDSFRWVPSSFDELGRVGAPYLHPADISSDGVVSVLLHGVVFNLPQQCCPTAVIAITVDEKVYYICQNVKIDNEPWKGINFRKADPSRYHTRPGAANSCW
jgi:hypothetical protein